MYPKLHLCVALATIICSVLPTTTTTDHHHNPAHDAAHAEHKVHNIVLYPERHSWCQTTPIRQIVSMPGYDPLTIDNNVCVGACYSYSIPRTQPAEPGETIGPYCDSCQPKTTQCYHVTLKKTGSSNVGGAASDDSAPVMRKRVQIITDCSCSSCEQIKSRGIQDDCEEDDANTSELPANLLAIGREGQEKLEGGATPEVPELMAVGSEPITAKGGGASGEVTTPQGRSYLLTDNLRKLLHRIQRDDIQLSSGSDDTDLRHLLEIVQGPDNQLSDRDVLDFVNWVNENFDAMSSEDNDDSSLELDALKLKDILNGFHHRELRLRHRKFGLGNTPILDNTISEVDDDDNDDVLTDERKHAHAHKIGDVISVPDGVAHLVMGPHGSFVLATPTAVGAERLSLASEEVVPNQEGTVIDYQHHGGHHHHHRQHHPHSHHRTHHGDTPPEI